MRAPKERTFTPSVGQKLCVTRATEEERDKKGYYKEFLISCVQPDHVFIQIGETHRRIDRVLIRNFREDEAACNDWMFVETPEAFAMEKSLAKESRTSDA